MNKSRNGKPNKGRSQGKPNCKPKSGNGGVKNDTKLTKELEEKLDTTRSNNPQWYFTDERLADQVSQLSFQNIAGYPIHYDGKDFDVPNIVKIQLNPCPGVVLENNYGTSLIQNSGLNLAAFRLYSKLSAFTGRTQSYAPQDVATIMLGFGEVISKTEWIRRAFGVAYTMNMRNRDYPREILEFGMQINATDLFTNLSDYRTRFNTIITLINQLPIPRSVAYFDKCASIYQRIFLDSDSSMAQTIITNPATTWILDEQSYSGGTILSTTNWLRDKNTGLSTGVQNMSVYLNTLMNMVSALLNSSSLTVVYTDILNYASKQSMEFWKFDYLFEDYQVIPEYDLNFLLQMHNATVVGMPTLQSTLMTSPHIITPLNDVYPNPSQNALYYNPALPAVGTGSNAHPATGSDVLIDMISSDVTLTDRVEVTRYSSCVDGIGVVPTGASVVTGFIDAALPDHYVVNAEFRSMTNNLTYHSAASTLLATTFPDISAQVANIAWAPRFWEYTPGSGYSGRYTSDINFYTTVNVQYLRRLHDFVALALYDIR